MLCLETRLQRNKILRAIGFDDAPFSPERGSLVNKAVAWLDDGPPLALSIVHPQTNTFGLGG